MNFGCEMTQEFCEELNLPSRLVAPRADARL
jgi:hypothetical protein